MAKQITTTIKHRYKLATDEEDNGWLQGIAKVHLPNQRFEVKSIVIPVQGQEPGSAYFYGKEKDLINNTTWRDIPHALLQHRESQGARRYEPLFFVPVTELSFGGRQDTIDELIQEGHELLPSLVEQAEWMRFTTDLSGRKAYGQLLSYFPRTFREAQDPQYGIKFAREEHAHVIKQKMRVLDSRYCG